MEGYLPNLIIGGAPKCATSSLHAWLSDHPHVLGSIPKETHYFVDPGTHMYDRDRHASLGLDGYRQFFLATVRTPHPRIVLESTPSYLYSETALSLLPDLPANPRFIFLLREPAAQIRSLYLYFRDKQRWIPHEMSFSDFLASVRTGSHTFRGNELARNALAFADYRPFLERWRERVGGANMRVYLFEHLTACPQRFLEEVCEWLQLDASFYREYSFLRENGTYAVRSQSLHTLNIVLRRAKLPEGRLYRLMRRVYRSANTVTPVKPSLQEKALLRRLKEDFAEANERLAASFGLDLSAWNTTPQAEERPNYLSNDAIFQKRQGFL
jgi:hypothetical protein